jgi:hypothetical protein
MPRTRLQANGENEPYGNLLDFPVLSRSHRQRATRATQLEATD